MHQKVLPRPRCLCQVAVKDDRTRPILHKLKWRVQFVARTGARYTFPQMRDLTMKPIFSLMGIACSQLA